MERVNPSGLCSETERVVLANSINIVQLTPYARVGALLERVVEVLRPVAAAVSVQLALRKSSNFIVDENTYQN